MVQESLKCVTLILMEMMKGEELKVQKPLLNEVQYMSQQDTTVTMCDQFPCSVRSKSLGAALLTLLLFSVKIPCPIAMNKTQRCSQAKMDTSFFPYYCFQTVILMHPPPVQPRWSMQKVHTSFKVTGA